MEDRFASRAQVLVKEVPAPLRKRAQVVLGRLALPACDVLQPSSANPSSPTERGESFLHGRNLTRCFRFHETLFYLWRNLSRCYRTFIKGRQGVTTSAVQKNGSVELLKGF